jgi:hypothetical protein
MTLALASDALDRHKCPFDDDEPPRNRYAVDAQGPQAKPLSARPISEAISIGMLSLGAQWIPIVNGIWPGRTGPFALALVKYRSRAGTRRTLNSRSVLWPPEDFGKKL